VLFQHPEKRKIMKKRIVKISAIALLVALPTLFTLAQPQPGQNAGGGAVTGGPIGGNAPVGSGLALLITLGAVWAGKRTYDAHRL